MGIHLTVYRALSVCMYNKFYVCTVDMYYMYVQLVRYLYRDGVGVAADDDMYLCDVLKRCHSSQRFRMLRHRATNSIVAKWPAKGDIVGDNRQRNV